MITADFSEASFSFAITREMVNGKLGNVVGRPEIPTLRQEGSSRGGYDVKIPVHHIPLFFQFKVPQVVTRTSHKKPIGYGLPYYRIHLRTNRPNQHQMLLDLESTNVGCVYYSTPIFHQNQCLDRYYNSDTIFENSAFFRPSDIGPLDENKHHIAYYKKRLPAYYCSIPNRIENKFGYEGLTEDVEANLREAQKLKWLDYLEFLGKVVVKTINKFGASDDESKVISDPEEYTDPVTEERLDREYDVPFKPLIHQQMNHEQIAQLARIYLGCELFSIYKE